MPKYHSIYLASKSPRRRELLTQIGVHYRLLSVDVDEVRSNDETPEQYVCRLSYDKAIAGCAIADDSPVLGADTIVVLRDEVLEKPVSQEHGMQMLMSLSGRTHQVLTAVTVALGKRYETQVVASDVTFREISYQEAQEYWNTGEPQDKAGGYGVQGMGAIFVERIEGSYSAVVGLPLFETSELLKAWDISLWNSGDR